MKEYEANECIKNIKYLDRDEKELLRYQLYVAINSNSKKQVSVKEILSLPWDNKFLNENEWEYNKEEEKELNDRADRFAEMLKNNKIQFETANNII